MIAQVKDKYIFGQLFSLLTFIAWRRIFWPSGLVSILNLTDQQTERRTDKYVQVVHQAEEMRRWIWKYYHVCILRAWKCSLGGWDFFSFTLRAELRNEKKHLRNAINSFLMITRRWQMKSRNIPPYRKVESRLWKWGSSSSIRSGPGTARPRDGGVCRDFFTRVL